MTRDAYRVLTYLIKNSAHMQGQYCCYHYTNLRTGLPSQFHAPDITTARFPGTHQRYFEDTQLFNSFKVDWVLDGHALYCKLGVSNDGWCHPVANPKYHMLQQVFSTLCIYQPCFTITRCHANYQHTRLCHEPRVCLKYFKDIWIKALHRESYILENG